MKLPEVFRNSLSPPAGVVDPSPVPTRTRRFSGPYWVVEFPLGTGVTVTPVTVTLRSGIVVCTWTESILRATLYGFQMETNASTTRPSCLPVRGATAGLSVRLSTNAIWVITGESMLLVGRKRMDDLVRPPEQLPGGDLGSIRSDEGEMIR